SLADSNAQIAHDLRREVFELMREGRSDAEIRDYLVDRYGEFVLYRPRFGGHTWLLWLGPALVLLAGSIVVARVVRSRSRQPLPAAAAAGGGLGMVSPVVLYAVMVLAAILLAAAVAWPLRRGSPRLFVAVLVALPVMALSLYRIVGTPQALDPDAVQVAEAGM